MSFTWKSHKDIWKGEGVYFLTFVVAGRRPLLGELVPLAGGCAGGGVNRSYMADVSRLPNNDGLPNNGRLTLQGGLPYKGWRAELCTSKLATVRVSELGLAILRDLNALPSRYSTQGADTPLLICAKQFMPDHLHVVIWVRRDVGKSIRQIAQGFRIGIRKIAAEHGVNVYATDGMGEQPDRWQPGGGGLQAGQPGDGGHFFEVPYIRTLASRGQLRRMIDYVHANPDNAWMRRLHPDLYVIRRNQQHAGLLFDTMGKARLLDYPDRNVVALSRSLTPEQIAQEVQRALLKAERGVVTYCAAINKGEKAVTRAVREAGYPLVVMMLDGFPPEGTEAARYFHPSGVYHTACGEGRLYLMAPSPANYNDSRLIALTEQELARKAAAKGQRYYGIPHTTKRWRMIAGNMMLQMILVG